MSKKQAIFQKESQKKKLGLEGNFLWFNLIFAKQQRENRVEKRFCRYKTNIKHISAYDHETTKKAVQYSWICWEKSHTQEYKYNSYKLLNISEIITTK